MDRRIAFALAWVVATVLAVVLGVLAVTTAGASLRGRGPLGDEVYPETSTSRATAAPDPAAERIRDRVTGDWGVFVVECRGTYAYGLRARAAVADGWRLISYEKGPDDDVDAVFSNGRNSVDLEVFCNRGRPTVAEIEENTLSD
ncbi:MAG: hypothetical protein JWQ74_1629 [Marmoricola sp.]|nr:hypothetical protein [Marmoricola sp.]